MPVRPLPADKLPSIERLNELFRLDAGVLYWKVRASPQMQAGSMAGTLSAPKGYKTVLIAGQRLKLHRIIFAMHYGYWPENYVDHIDGDATNNDPANLREVTHLENMQNIAVAASRTGFLGVSTKRKKLKSGVVATYGYYYTITVDGKQLNGPLCKTPEEAHIGYLEAKRKYHPAAIAPHLKAEACQ